MPSPTETRRLIDDIINQTSRTTGAAVAVTGDLLSQDAKMNMVHLRLELKSDLVLVEDVDMAAKAGGAKILDLPAGFFSVLASRIEGTLTTDVADLTSTAGELGLGTAAASGANATLGASGATHENILEGGQPALSNMTAGNDLTVLVGDGVREPVGTFASAADVYLNIASTWGNVAAAADVSIKAGAVIELWGILVEA